MAFVPPAKSWPSLTNINTNLALRRSVYVSINNKEFRLAAVPQGSNPQTIQVRR